MKFYHGILMLCAMGGCTHSSNSFVIKPPSNNNHVAASSQRQMSVSGDDSTAKAFTDYMAKSHMEKLKALKDLEERKNKEIETLKEEMTAMKSGSGGGDLVQAQAQQPPVVEGSVEDLSAKLFAYQKFMSEYIVKAQEEKNRAVKAAEAAIAKKYEEKLNAFMLPGSSSDAGVLATTKSDESKLYQERNSNIAAAAKAGKSRWGNKELEKVAGISVENKTLSSSAPVESAVPQPDREEAIAAADHGLRADGGVGGLTLAERVTEGAEASTAALTNGVAVPSSVSSSSPLYDLRNAKVSQAAKAGKQSRWGTMEEKKAIEISSNALPAAAAANGKEIIVTPEIDAADHGLRADGGVGGPSLAERVNLGALLLQ